MLAEPAVDVVPGALTCTVSVACSVLLTLFGATVFEVFDTALDTRRR